MGMLNTALALLGQACWKEKKARLPERVNIRCMVRKETTRWIAHTADEAGKT